MPVWLQQILTLAIPIIVGIVTVPIVNLFKQASTWLDKQPDVIKQLLVLLFAYGANLIAQKTGITLPTSIGGFDSASVGTLITTILAYILHLASSVSTVKTAISTPTVATVQSIPARPAVSPNIK